MIHGGVAGRIDLPIAASGRIDRRAQRVGMMTSGSRVRGIVIVARQADDRAVATVGTDGLSWRTIA